MAKRPHRLELYEAAVQQPAASVALLDRMYRWGRSQAMPPLLLREDFAGSAALSEAWVQSHPERQAIAVELDGPTYHYAQRVRGQVADLHLVEADVMSFTRPRVDVVAALNFSAMIYHDRSALLRYLKHAKQCLEPGGILVLDLFGGSGAQRTGVQTRPADGFTYVWEQRQFDAATHRLDCRIHFSWPDGSEQRSAFRYDWRLWSIPEVTELMAEAGFAGIQIWAERDDGSWRPARRLPPREDWVAYLVATREGGSGR